MRRYIIVALVLCVLVGVACAWPDSMNAWDYRKEITINNTGANLTNYQLMFTVNRSAGTDSGFTVFLNGKCESDYDDIRFTTSDEETLCDYWIESSSSTVANIWVEAPSIVNSTAYGSTTLYLYYGNSGATAASDGGATFPFFDDFPGSSLDTDKWDGSTASASVSGGRLYLAPGEDWVQLYSKGSYVWNRDVAIHAKVQFEGRTTGKGSIFGFRTASLGGNWIQLMYYANAGESDFRSTTPSFSVDTNTDTNNNIYEITWLSSGYTATKNGVAMTGSPQTGTTIGVSTPISFEGKGSGYGLHCDYVFVRKYTATEPTVSAWGSEEMGEVINIYPNFSGVPTSGYVPLTVYFTDLSTSENCTINTWQWSFGDSSPNSTQQNPAHTYITSGLYNVILTITNTSFSLTNSTQKIGYINATYDHNAPTADFTVTETCGETTDTFYFIDFSTGGGLYAWNWSFGDGSYSELRNPTHQYAANGTYDVTLTVTGAYGSDTLLRENLITVPCGAATPTPTPTVTPTGTGNVTEGNATYIYAPDQDYVPFPIWLAIVIVTIALFGHSIIFLKNSDLTAIMAALFAMISAWLSNMIGYIDVQVTSYAEEIVISPVVQAVHPSWLVYTMLIFAFVSVVNIFAAIYKVYLKSVPWNEIYDRKLPKWERRK